MAQCAYCGTETPLHINDVPSFVQCTDLSPDKRAVRVRLFGQYTEAVKRADSANEAFAAVAGSIPSGTPLPMAFNASTMRPTKWRRPKKK